MNRIFLRAQYAVHDRRARDFPVGISSPSEYVALFPQKSPCRVELNGESLTLRPEGDALLVNPGPAEATVAAGRGEYLLLFVTPLFFLDCAVRAQFTHGDALLIFRAPTVVADRKLARITRDLAEEMQQAEAGQDMVITALVEQILVHLLRRYSNARRADNLELSRAGLVDRRIRRAVELMHAQMAEDLPLKQIAAAAYLSTFHFARLFKKLTGVTPHAYLAALRAARARLLLAESDLSVTEVAARVGYTSSSHFTKAFRQATGLTPREFRASLVSRDVSG